MADKSKFTYTPAPTPRFTDEVFTHLTYSQKLQSITGSPWDRCTAASLADVRKLVGQDLVEYPGMPEAVFLKAEVDAAELRAELMAEKVEDIVVTLVCNVIYIGHKGVLHIESVPYSQLTGRITELKEQVVGGTVKVWIAYSEETKQMFGWNDLVLHEKPRLPEYGQEYDRKRKGFRD